MMNERHSKTAGALSDVGHRLQGILFWTCMSLLALVPLAFTTAVYRTFALPKFAILLVGSTVILLLLAVIAASDRSRIAFAALKSTHVALVLLYIILIAVATLFGVSPLASLFGSYQNEMGLITRLSLFTCFVGLIVSVGHSTRRLVIAAWAMALTGLLVAAYAVAQVFGRDPFLPSFSYTFNSPSGPVVRIPGTLGHSNYLGNFLLYTTPLAAALAIASRGRARRFALATGALSIAAIAFSGTRGAWVGIMAGALTFAFLELRHGGERRAQAKKNRLVGAAIVLAIILVSMVVVVSSPASRSLSLRARSFVADRFTGSGRVLLWRDAARMIPRFALIGCGPEGFSKAFLSYKSMKLAIHAPQINNESSHNSYLDAAISFGLPGAILYIIIIVSAFSLLLRSRRRTADQQTKFIITGLVSSLVAVTVHNFFIYDQIPTGLYFFAFMALAVIVSRVTGAREIAAEEKQTPEPHPSATLRWTARAAAVASVAPVVAAAWFSVSLVQGDIAVKRAFASASQKDFDGLVANGERATRSAEPTGVYNFLFARALALYADAIARDEKANNQLNADGTSLSALRVEAVKLASVQAEKSLAHTLTPESNYVLLAYLAFAEGDAGRLRRFASEAIRWDPNYFNARWLMAEALLAEGDRDQAMREAELALQLRPGNSEARSVLARARGEAEFVSPRIQGLVERARLLVEKGNLAKAQELLNKAIVFANGPCPACHRALALVYEQAHQYEDAIAEWQAFAREAPERAATEQVVSRIETLNQK